MLIVHVCAVVISNQEFYCWDQKDVQCSCVAVVISNVTVRIRKVSWLRSERC